MLEKNEMELNQKFEGLRVPPTLPDYSDSILNLSCSIQKYFGVTPKHSTLPEADSILAKNYKHVVVILLDGLGMNVLEKNLTPFDFLRRKLVSEYSSVFPPTTTASTTSFLSGLEPIEHGWLGWDVFFQQENKTVTCFTNNLQGTNEPAADYNVVKKYFGYESIIDQINKAGRAKANCIFPFGPNGFSDFKDWMNEIRRSCKTEEQTFTYAYWEDPDHALHREGMNSNTVREIIEDLNANLLVLCEELKDTVVFITADHGHISITNEFIQEDYPELAEMLERPVSIEPRAISFYVKPDSKDAFREFFNEKFSQDYVLFTKDEILKFELFGTGFPHANLTGIGDFVAVACSSRTLLWNKKNPQFRSHHAGLTKEEMRIPLICHEYKKNKTPLIVFYSVIAIIVLFILMCLF